MAITITDGTTTIDLPNDLQWVDEFAWSAVEQQKDYSLTGAVIVQQGVKQKGRPITLQSNGGAWIKRSTLKALQAFYDTPDQVFELDLWGEIYAVQFERPDGLGADEVLRQADPDPDHYYTITLKLFEVATP
ncbi:hypothetical protein [Spongiibacter sp. UBA1325]|uniref:hypothetical protein n=1 Tax=Spongiibacter sp. UBA1325 TaxID=1947543 RepID=UPI0025800CC3|nr:hypothetical protein [Spongiibacter sp. UBA1325]|tara:strand:+ start:104 stop:499 length:396 start_codon:yes stop_codon:yes gene_type:complete